MKFLLIDSHLVFGSVYHLMKNDGGDFTPTLFFRRCLKVIENSAKKISPTHSLFCMDDFSRSEKKISFPGYRSDSFVLPIEFYSSLPLFLKGLKDLGIAYTSSSASESYDIMATLISKARTSIPGSSFIVMATDKRLYCYFEDDFSMYNPFSRGSKTINDFDWFKSKTEFNPAQWTDILSLVGYKERGIPGVHGVGIKKAESLIAQYGSVHNMVMNIDSIEGPEGENFKSSIINGIHPSHWLSYLNENLSLGITPNQMIYSR